MRKTFTWILIISFAGGTNLSDDYGFKLWSEGPNFDTDLPQDVTGVVGQTAYLSCRVFDRENKTISWIRHSDLHILTVGRYTYTADLRYQSIYNSATDEWILQIRYLKVEDKGMYECQVSSQPVRSFFVRLNVVDILPIENSGRSLLEDQPNGARTRILSGKEVHVEQGSTLNLTCVVHNAKTKPHYLLWFFKNQTIDYTSPRGGISVVNSEQNPEEGGLEGGRNGVSDRGSDGGTEVVSDKRVESPGYTSTLLIHKVGPGDIGNYSCQPSNSAPASVMVYVVKDWKQENLVVASSAIINSYPPNFLYFTILYCSSYRY